MPDLDYVFVGKEQTSQTHTNGVDYGSVFVYAWIGGYFGHKRILVEFSFVGNAEREAAFTKASYYIDGFNAAKSIAVELP